MKIQGWGKRWEWERSREITIFALGGKFEQGKLAIIKELKEMLQEFSVPLDVTDGNLKYDEDIPLVQNILDSSIKEYEIDYDEFIRELSEAREEGRLPYGLAVLVDKDQYTFYQPQDQKERAIYGVGLPNGIVILRHIHREAVRHEFGHMLGLGIHHIGCVMDYNCITSAFCSQCKTRIEQMWREEIDTGRYK